MLDNAKDNISPRWDISQERALNEGLVSQRFNFLLIFYSIFIAAAVNARELPLTQATVLTIGTVITYCLMLTIGRTQDKLDVVLSILFQDASHPVGIINDRVKGPSRRKLLGHTVPFICFISLMGWAVIAWARVLGIMPH